MASDLLKLYDYVEGLPDDHPIFMAFYYKVNEEQTVYIVKEIRNYGYQNTSEEPEKFIKRLTDELFIKGFRKDIDSREN